MKVLAKNDLVRRTPPRLEKFHTVKVNDNNVRGITYWKKGYFDASYCESKNAYVCQRSAAAGAGSEANGETSSF